MNMNRVSSIPSEINASYQEQMNVLRTLYSTRLTENLAQIEIIWKELNANESNENEFPGDSNAIQDKWAVLHRLTHSLAGSGATFGFPLVSQHARRAEIVIKRIVREKQNPNAAQCADFEAAYTDLKKAALQSLPETMDWEDLAPVEAGNIHEKWIYILCAQSSSNEIENWETPLEAFSYRTRIFHQIADLKNAVLRQTPAALIVDCEAEPLEIAWDGQPLSAALLDLCVPFERTFPLVWTSKCGDLRTRLQAVRLGGAAFFTHPVDIDALTAKLDDLTSHCAPEPFRVLIIDDEPALARLLGLMLQQVAMETRVVTDPLQVMAHLVDFRPDLILMDVYMPGCSGTELASVIRQQEAYVSIPIVYLSVETDISVQQEAMRQGGDDFLMKPVEPRHLVSAVSTRAARARILRNLMMRDSLTGLLNHTKTKEQLGVELNRAQRTQKPVSLAMVDIDRFKSVNDSYGHAMGDRIIRSLSRLLVQRLRQTDVVGRYGGEEFAVIFSGANAQEASAALEKVRESFEALVHNSEGREFRVTFSAGLASTSQFATASEISEAADRALYQAKHTGRNRIVCAD